MRGTCSPEIGDLVDGTSGISRLVGGEELEKETSKSLEVCYLCGESCHLEFCSPSGSRNYPVGDSRSVGSSCEIVLKLGFDLLSGSQLHQNTSLTCRSCEMTLEVVGQHLDGRSEWRHYREFGREKVAMVSSCRRNSKSGSRTCILYQSVPLDHSCSKVRSSINLGGTGKVKVDVVVEVEWG